MWQVSYAYFFWKPVSWRWRLSPLRRYFTFAAPTEGIYHFIIPWKVNGLVGRLVPSSRFDPTRSFVKWNRMFRTSLILEPNRNLNLVSCFESDGWLADGLILRLALRFWLQFSQIYQQPMSNRSLWFNYWEHLTAAWKVNKFILIVIRRWEKNVVIDETSHVSSDMWQNANRVMRLFRVH